MTTRHEAQVDTKLSELWGVEQACYAALETARDHLAFYTDAERTYVGKKKVYTQSLADVLEMPFTAAPYYREQYDKLVAKVADTKAKLAAAKAEAAPLEAEYNAKRWSRFFLVQNTGGHIHKDMHCSTCNKWTVNGYSATRFGWLPELSGLTEKDAVDAHGTILCSVCFPSAPVEWTVGLTKPVDPDQCPGSGTTDHDSSGIMYFQKRARCNHCHKTTSVTSTLKMRKHKKGSA